MAEYTVRLLPPTLESDTLRVQALPCTEQWWWANVPSTALNCSIPETPGICNTTLTVPDTWVPGVWVRGIWQRRTVEGEGAVTEWSGASNVVEYGNCPGDEPPQPVSEPGMVAMMVVGMIAAVLLARLRG